MEPCSHRVDPGCFCRDVRTWRACGAVEEVVKAARRESFVVVVVDRGKKAARLTPGPSKLACW